MTLLRCTRAMQFLRIALLLFVSSQHAFSQYDFKWQTDGTVNSTVINNNVLYIGGTFTYVGQYYGCMTAADYASGAHEPGWPVVNETVNSIIGDGTGGWYVGGAFTQVNNTPLAGLCHLNPDKSLDLSWNPNVVGNVQCMVLSGTTLYIGGTFTAAGGQTRSNLAAIDITTGNATSWMANTNGSVKAMAISGTTIYVGGNFSVINGVTNRSHLAAIDMSGTITGWDPNPTYASTPDVSAIVVSGSTVYVGGFFNNIGTRARNNIAAIDAATGIATAWDPNVNGAVHSLLLDGSTIYAGGFFTRVNNLTQLRRYIAQFDLTANTINALPWDPNANSAVMKMCKVGNIVYAGGQFTTIGGKTRRKLAALDATINTSNATSWDPNMGNGWDVSSLMPTGTSILVGGSFTSANGAYRNNIAAIDLVTNTILPWNPNANGNVNVIKVTGSTVYAGGDFTNIGGATRNRLAVLDLTTGNAVSSWDPNVNNSVRALAVSGGMVYAGGDFTSIGSPALTRNRLVEIDAAGNATAWNPDVNGPVLALEVNGSTLYAGGSFTKIGAITRNRVTAFNLSSSNSLLSWNPDVDNTVRTIAVATPAVYIGGDFIKINSNIPRARIAAVDETIGTVTNWAPDANGAVNSMAIVNRVLYAAGSFSVAGGSPQRNVVALDMDRDLNSALVWNLLPGSTFSLNTITVSSPNVYVGGTNSASGSTRAFYLSYIPSFDVLLPAHTMNFTAQKQDDHSLLQWSSDDEPGTRYQLERAIGKKNFTTIAERMAGATASTYRVTDPLTEDATYYYRIKVIDVDQKSWYSTTKAIDNKAKLARIYPTLITAGEPVTVTLVKGRYSFSLYTPGGQLALQQYLSTGINTIVSTQLANGNYFYIISDPSNGAKQTGQLTISRR